MCISFLTLTMTLAIVKLSINITMEVITLLYVALCIGGYDL